VSTERHGTASLPEAARVTLPNRGTTNVWDIAATQGGHETPILLLHGWNIDAPANFGSAVADLSEFHRIVMYDQHGHGGGVRAPERFTFEAAADDAIAVLDAVGISKAIVLGYSMGGAIAQLVARSAPDRCTGLVLSATADRFSERHRERAQFATFGVAARAVRRLPPRVRRIVFNRVTWAACYKYPPWIRDTVRAADPVTLLEAGAQFGQFDSTDWNRDLEQPSAFIVTQHDVVVDPTRQMRLASSLGVVHLDHLDAGHNIPILDDPRYGAALRNAVDAVVAAEAAAR
jgi:3-oxoadipate enol-lactonase